jgi:uncharacterized protein YjfI (DUF2170 family)
MQVSIGYVIIENREFFYMFEELWNKTKLGKFLVEIFQYTKNLENVHMNSS